MSSAADDFDAFYAARAATLVRLLYLRTGDLTRAQDCVQEAFTQAWLKWSTLEAGPDPVAWVRTVAWNLAVNDWRSRRRERARDERMGYGVGSEAGNGVPVAEALAVREALRHPPGHQQTAIVLHYFEDLSIPEIAAMTGTPVGTIKSSLHRARISLRHQLEDNDPDSDRVIERAPTPKGGPRRTRRSYFGRQRTPNGLCRCRPAVSFARAQTFAGGSDGRGGALVAAACAAVALTALPGLVAPSPVVNDAVPDAPRVGGISLDRVPEGWSVTRQEGTSDMARACLGPDSKPCAIQVVALYEPARDSGIDWFSLLTAPCLSPKTTSVLSTDARLPAGPGQKYSLECAGEVGDLTNVAWVLDAGVAVVPDSASEVDGASAVVDGLRFTNGTPVLPPPGPSEEPSASAATGSG